MRLKGENYYLDVNLWDLYVFQSINETRNASISAKKIGVTQSAVSQSLARLESWLGVELIDRSCRPIRLTRAGQILIRGITNTLQNLQQTVGEVRAAGQQDVPMLRLGLIDSLATTLGPEIVRSLSGRIEHLQMWSGITPTLTNELLSRSVDVIICNDAMKTHTELSQRFLLKEPLVAAVPTSKMDLFRQSTLTQMCDNLPFIRFSARSHLGQSVEYYLNQRKLIPRKVIEFDASEAVLRMVGNGAGWTIATPICLMQAHSQMLDIAILPLPQPFAYRHIYLVYRKNELTLIMPDIIKVFQKSISETIIPIIQNLTPWADISLGEKFF